jgi:4-hydroxythreonine-4-phosphate dehydrogenase
MLMGCSDMFVALFTDHIAIKDVATNITLCKLNKFLLDLYQKIGNKHDKIAVLGLNPHSGDGGAIGCEDAVITQAINKTNKQLSKDIFVGPVVPDVAFTYQNRQKYKLFVAMYHDQGLAPLKALFFENVINISLGDKISRTSVGHGTAFDIAYTNSTQLSNTSYINAIKYKIC